MQDVKIRKKVPVNIRKLLFERVERANEDLSKKTHNGFVYLIEVGHNNIPYFLVSTDCLVLGEQDIAVKPYNEIPITTEKELDVLFSEDPFLKRRVMSEHRDALTKWKTKKEKEGWTDDPPSYLSVFQEISKKEGYKTYIRTTPVELEDLQKLSEKELETIFDDYISHGWEIAPELRAIMRAGLVQFSPDAAHQLLMKYRGHCLMIKGTKTGVSTISQRIGTNIDHISTKSIEGHASSDGIIQHSSLHNEWGHVNIDEFLEMPENLLQHMFNYLELGTFQTHKASRIIKNYGAPRICFTANPMDVDGVDFAKVFEEKGTEIIGSDGQTTFAPNEDKERLMYTVFKQSINQLTKVSNAAFSRLGIIIFSPNLASAKRTEKAGEIAYLETVDGIAESVFEHARENTTKIFYECETWLNLPMEEYNNKIDSLLNGSNHSEIKNIWCGQKDAYRHIRGHALCEAILDHIHEVLNGKYDVATIQETAEDNLKYAQEMNLDSLRNCVLAQEKYADDPEVLKIELQRIRPAYIRALLLGYVMAAQGKEEKKEISFAQMQFGLEEIPLKTRKEVLGGYANWSKFEKRINMNKVKRTLKTLDLGNLVHTFHSFCVNKRAIGKLQSTFSEMGVKIPNIHKVHEKQIWGGG